MTAALKPMSVLTAALSLVALGQSTEPRALKLARTITVSTLGPELPKQTLVHWLTRAAGRGARIEWSVTDCGEQAGNPENDRRRDFPSCVEAVVSLPHGRTAVVSIVVGSVRRGVTGRPRLWSAEIGNGSHFEPVPDLRDLAAKMKSVD